MNPLDDILAELSQIRDRLAEAIDAAERIDLHERRKELRRRARQAQPTSTAELRARLDRLVAAWDELQRRRIDVVKQAGDLAAGNFGLTSDAVRLNQQIDLAAGRQELEERIRNLRARLEELGG